MKIGLSYSRCVLDIVEGRVDIEDVLVLITRTDFDPRDDAQWTGIWGGYCLGGASNAEWGNYNYNSKEDEDKFRSVSIMSPFRHGSLTLPSGCSVSTPTPRSLMLSTATPPTSYSANMTINIVG